jgi:diguanylate cyclase (GGDEF)-like protein
MDSPTFWHYLTSSLAYTLRAGACALIIDIMLRHRKTSIYIWAPVIVLGILTLTSKYTHIVFYFSETNAFARGPLGYLPHIICGVYLAAIIVMTIKMHRDITTGEIFALLFIAGICVLATVLESVLNDCRFAVTGAMIDSCAIYYSVLYIETYERDPLTGLTNRRSFYLDAEKMKNKELTLISIDLNGLKEINDKQGHQAGDKALQTVGSVLHETRRKNCFTYRIGGDEFMVVCKKITEEDVNEYVDTMRKKLVDKGFSAAFGWAVYHPSDSFDDICNQADSRMYEDKNKHKHHRTSSRD